MDVDVANRQRAHPVDREALRDFLLRLVQTMPPDEADSVAVSLVSDRRMREYNLKFRGRDRATDVLSFPADAEPDPAGHRHLGDVAISVATAARQADRAGHSLQRELCCLALHGYLHLIGHDHETDDGRMIRLERELERRLLDDEPRKRA